MHRVGEGGQLRAERGLESVGCFLFYVSSSRDRRHPFRFVGLPILFAYFSLGFRGGMDIEDRVKCATQVFFSCRCDTGRFCYLEQR